MELSSWALFTSQRRGFERETVAMPLERALKCESCELLRLRLCVNLELAAERKLS